MLEFPVRAASFYLVPVFSDAISFDYFGDTGEWVPLYDLHGDGHWHPEFIRHSVVLPPGTLHAGFQLRLTSRSPRNVWYIDDLAVGPRPHCAVGPEVVDLMLDPGEQAVAGVTLSNTGPGNLAYNVRLIPLVDEPVDHAAKGPWGLPTLAAGVPSSWPTKLKQCAIGGPDNFGYIWMDSDQPHGPPFIWEDISSSGTPLKRLSSAMYDTFHMGFQFPYYDTVYTEMLVGTKGALQFGKINSIETWTPLIMPYPYPPDNMLAWCWADHNTLGTVRTFSDLEHAVIQFDQFGDSTNPGARTASAQVVLTAEGDISYRYLRFGEDFYTRNCSVGLEGPGGVDGLGNIFFVNLYQSDPGYLHDSMRIDFYRPIE